MSRNVDTELRILYPSGQPTGPIFKGSEVFLDFLTLEDGTDIVPKRRYRIDFLILEDGADRLARNVGTELRLYAA